MIQTPRHSSVVPRYTFELLSATFYCDDFYIVDHFNKEFFQEHSSGTRSENQKSFHSHVWRVKNL